MSNCIGGLNINIHTLMKLHFVSQCIFSLFKNACIIIVQLFKRKFYYEKLEKKTKVSFNYQNTT